jgi:23S rRNA (uridine2552-2'-O)-methyltransferase
MARTKHGKSWMQRHLNDPYVQKAQAAGLRSRASFKLLELHERDRIFRQGMFVVDLGAAPGGWSQVVAKLVGSKGKVIALDRLPMEPLNNVTVLEGDFIEEAVLKQLQAEVGDNQVDWVLSDMSPNLSGLMAVDQPRIMELAELALEFAQLHLKNEGGLLVKMFQGEGFESLIKDLRQKFRQVLIRKPNASRSESRELYVLARGYYNI